MPIPWDHIGVGSGWALVAFFVWLVLTGRLIPKSTHEREIDAAEHSSNEWRAEGRIKDQAIIATLDQVKETGEETGKTLHHFIAALQRVIDVTPSQQGSRDVSP